jgi:ubiquitin C-terminal hydrolase
MVNNNNNNNNNKKKFTGVTGLYNIGNTCYMSSALQCLSHVRHLKNYVNSGVYSNEINYENVLGSHGALVLHLAQLLRALWEG